VAWNPIVKAPQDEIVHPNLDDYQRTCAAFSWDEARRELDGLPGGRGLNIAHEAVDRHAAGPRRDHIALRWLGKRGEVEEFSYARLAAMSSRFANVLAGLGVGRGDRVYALAGRIPALYVAALGALKHGSIFCPLFSAFGPEPIRARLAIGRARVLVTTEALYRRKVAPLRPSLPDLEHVLLAGGARPARPAPAISASSWPAPATATPSGPRTRRMPRSCTSPAARRASPRGRSTCTARSSPTTSPGGSRSTCTRTTSTGARRIRDG
jgi:acetyl-CoA synthetase